MRNRLILFHNLVSLSSSMFGNFSCMAGKNTRMNLKSCSFYFFIIIIILQKISSTFIG